MYFTDYYKVKPEVLEKYGALNISLVTDLPLFIDPFLIFNSKEKEYQVLHEEMIQYLKFLRDKALEKNDIRTGLINAWYKFPEVSQNWLGFSESGNKGRGLGRDFAKSLHENLFTVFRDFADEQITKNSHLEKLCLIKDGVGKDCISDSTTNLIKGYLLTYTEKFATENINKKYLRTYTVQKVSFDYETESWVTKRYTLPEFKGDYVLLTPKDLLTRDDTWINKEDLINNFQVIPLAISNEELRAEINNYFVKLLPKKPTRKDHREAAVKTIHKYPDLVDYYIKFKEDRGDLAVSLSSEKVEVSEEMFVENMGNLIKLLATKTKFYQIQPNSFDEALNRINFLKHVIEDQDGYRWFYSMGKPIRREQDLHVAYRLVWYNTDFDVNNEVNNGRGPADSKVSLGDADKTIVEMKLASSSHLERNLLNQPKIYTKANRTDKKIVVIIFFTQVEQQKVNKIILDNADQLSSKEIILIDARNDNKPSASKA